jgi:hypothetical protein
MDSAADEGVDLIIFPGFTRFRSKRDPKVTLQSQLDWMVKRLRRRKMSGLFEVNAWTDEDPSKMTKHQSLAWRLSRNVKVEGGAFIYNHKRDRVYGPYLQRLLNSHEAETQRGQEVVRGIIEDLEPGGERHFKRRRRFGFLLCGELNVLRNIQTQGNRAELRVGYTRKQWRDYDVMLYIGHVSLGNMHKMMQRWAFLSQGGKWCFANMNNQHKTWDSALYVYHDGKMILSGNSEGVIYPEHESWSMAVVDV